MTAVGICVIVVAVLYLALSWSDEQTVRWKVFKHRLTEAKWRIELFFGVQPTDPEFVSQQRNKAILAYVRERAEAAARDPNIVRDPNWRIDPNEVLRLGSSPPGTLRQ